MKLPKLITTEDFEGYEYKAVLKFLGPKAQEFRNWFAGKTGGITNKGKYVVYKYDFDKFLEFTGILRG
jgi:hypothetical protein